MADAAYKIEFYKGTHRIYIQRLGSWVFWDAHLTRQEAIDAIRETAAAKASAIYLNESGEILNEG